MSTTTRRARIPWPPDPDEHRPCKVCSRCVSGTGRDRDPDASDCYVDWLEAATVRRSA
ncbi:hypothetical protein [Kitasatospora fiedleri]|uniref:hypothetical protein n=1 Tax=Kitasatospora fiedleri TaxID=2991545 RepID=UPI00249B2006|nr:hypothetical protein [Kitasatospora fiedleri]